MLSMSPIEAKVQSENFFLKPDSYSPFGLTDYKRIVGCIEPRDPQGVEPGQHKVVVQTAGGAAGEALDSALALTIDNKAFVTIEEGLLHDNSKRQTTVFGAHLRCAFIGSLPLVLGEMANPSEMTVDTVKRWSHFFSRRELVDDAATNIAEAASRQLEYVRSQNDMGAALVRKIDSLHPEQAKTRDVRGKNTAQVYVMNMHPLVGLDRNKKRGDPSTIQRIQGYHDSLAASIGDLNDAQGLTGRERGLRFVGMLFRSAATRTILTQDKLTKMTFLEVRAARDGLQIVEEDWM